MKKRLFGSLALVLGLAAVPTVAAHADPFDYLPPCVVYVSAQQIPVSANCAPYTLPNGQVLNALSINE